MCFLFERQWSQFTVHLTRNWLTWCQQLGFAEPAQLTSVWQMMPSFFRRWLAYFCLFALHPPSLLPFSILRCPSTCTTLPHPAPFFFLSPFPLEKSGGIYPSEIKKEREKKEPTGASWGKDCISSHEPQDGRTGQHASKTDSLPLVHCNDASLEYIHIYEWYIHTYIYKYIHI